MAVSKLLNLIAISCLVIIASYGTAPVSALSVDTQHHGRHGLHHAVVAKKRRATSSRCKPRSSTIAPVTTSTSSATPAPSPTKSASNSGGSGNSNPGNSNSGNSGNGNSGNSGNPGSGSSGGNSGGGAGKAGLAWPLGNDPAIKNFKSWKTNVYYTWSPWLVEHADSVGMKGCPMLWGHKQRGDFQNLVKAGYADCVLGFNEPNQHDQANMNPQDGAQLWKDLIEPLKHQGYTLVSPATTSAASGKKWMQDFFTACNGCQIDVVALHWYGTNADAFIAYVEDFHKTFGKNIWVTEFACQDFSGGRQCSWDQVFEFMRKVTDFMDNTPYVELYFAFGALHDMYNVNPFNQLLGGNGYPTDLGRLYIGL